MNINFSSKDGRYHLYHAEGLENRIKWLTRFNVFLLLSNSVLFALELMNPFFGFWHALSEGMICILALVSARFLHHYSTRMVNNLWLLSDGRNIEIDFMNAFFEPTSEKLRIMNFGYLQESRIYNISCATY